MDNLKAHIIPDNFIEEGRIFNGMFKTRNFIEAAVLAGPVALLCYFLSEPVSVEWRIFFVLVPSISVFALAVYGVYGDSLFEFLGHVIRFNHSKRVAKYNNRVKHEARPDYLISIRPNTPMDAFVTKVRQILFHTSENEIYDASDIYNPMNNEFFVDDYGSKDVAVPDSLKSKKQLRSEAKERKRIQKKAKKIRRENDKKDMIYSQEGREYLKRVEREERNEKRRTEKAKKSRRSVK